jgi:protoporphyrinogen oxidase
VKDPGHVVILGAGPAGLAAAHELTLNGAKVTVLERNDYVGGLCRTVKYKGYKFDLGGHRWFTKNEDLNTWFRRLMGDEIVMVDRISRIYYGGKYFFYPIRFGDILRKTGPFTILHAGLAFLWALLVQSAATRPPANMKEAYVAQFGSKLYDMFFRRYSEKVWGRPCEELSSDWVSQRSKGLSIWTLVRDALVGNKEQVTSLIDNFMYPRDGYVRIPERMAEDIEARGNEVLRGAGVTRLVYHGANDIEVFYRSDGEERSVRASAVLSTLPLGLLVQMLTPACGKDVAEAARGLVFRDLITVNVIFRRQQVSSDTWLYVQDEDVLFGRLHEPKNWSKAMVPDGERTSLVLECFCTRGDALWNMSDEQIVQRCVRDLVDKLKFVRDEEFEDAAVVRTTHAYPVYDLQYATKIDLIKAFLAGFEGLHIVGRGGTFRYNNADHSIEMGLLLGRKLLGYEVDHLAVNTEPEYQEIKRGDEIRRDHFTDATTASGRQPEPARSKRIVVD